ncbi:uncharacterized protein L201_000597 [Kwoniella dendrophila CBS 6074]|uniref:Uncharacterized protein n=1 Tax=Kwoniella dendrophila CBS 6074 TaxID=1295534 RepID=A0AAX4JL59_9TREE
MSTIISPSAVPDLDRSVSTHSFSSTIDDSQNSQLHLNQVTSSSNGDSTESETLITPVDPPSILQVSIKNGSSPIKIQSTIDEEDLSSSEIRSPITKESKKGRLNLSKSMQTLRKKKGAEKGGRERASSVGEKTPPPPVPAVPVISEKKSVSQIQPKTSAPIPQRPPMPSKQSSGFSSFLRKLTGRSNTSPAPTSSTSEKSIKEDKSATLSKRKTMAFGGGNSTNKPTLSKIDTSKSVKGPTLASAIPSKINQTPTSAVQQFVQSPLPVTPIAPPVKETDPCRIPLPPSPTLESLSELSSEDVPALDFSAPPPTASQQSTITKKKAEGMLSFEGFDIEEEEDEPISKTALPSNPVPILAPVVDTTMVLPTKEDSESKDVVRPLAPIRIPSRNVSGGSGLGPESASSVRSSVMSSSVETKISTPLSPSSPSTLMRSISGLPQNQNETRRVSPSAQHQGLSPEKMYEGMKLAGSSPPRKAPVGTGPMNDLGRKESKWRKSVMNLSDKTKPSSKRQSAVPPPTSHDAYKAQQARIAKNRQSCAPTLHSQASIAATASRQLTKDEQDMAETFFMS